MADTPNQDSPRENDPATETPEASSTWLNRVGNMLLTRKALAIALGMSVLLHGLVFAGLKLQGSPKTPPPVEISLGEFRFRSSQPGPGQVREARFSLHLALLEEVAHAADGQLRNHAFRAEQDVEQLLRQANSRDFDDPLMAEMKRQFQEQLNRTLGFRAIDEVIITDLEVQRTPEATSSVVETAESLSWTDAPAG